MKSDSRRNVFIGTIPRSGTNLLSFFNVFMDHFLTDRYLEVEKLLADTDTIIKLNGKRTNSKGISNVTLRSFVVAHSFCPGFMYDFEDPLKKNWESLAHDEDWWNAAASLLQKHKSEYLPQLNPGVRIVFLYRNPLDVFVSLFFHLKNHKHAPPFSNFNELVKRFMPRYVKSFYSYHQMTKRFPENVRMFAYEDLMRNKCGMMLELYKFIGFRINRAERIAAFAKTLEITSEANMRKIELSLGETLANDQKLPPQKTSHLRGGETGKWRNYFSDDLLRYTKELFEHFGIELSSFQGI